MVLQTTRISTPDEALLVIQAARLGVFCATKKRLSAVERDAIVAGDVHVYSSQTSGIQRWTDGKLWSPSRITGNFLVYTELLSKTKDLPDERSCGESRGKLLRSDDGHLGMVSSKGTAASSRRAGLPHRWARQEDCHCQHRGVPCV